LEGRYQHVYRLVVSRTVMSEQNCRAIPLRGIVGIE